MTPVARQLGDEWGVDLDAPVTLTARTLAASTVRGFPVTWVMRYVFFGPPHAGDLTLAETGAILDAGLALVVVQHVRSPGWTAGPQLGASDGQWAARNAGVAGYAPGMGLFLVCDLEGVKNSGQAVAEHVDAWCQAVIAGGYAPALYVGYDCGLSPSELYDLPHVSRYLSDDANRTVAVRGTCALQYPEVTLSGVGTVEPDHAHPDALGGTLTGLCAAPDVS